MDQQTLIAQIMTALRQEVECLWQDVAPDQATLEQTEQRCRRFAQRAGAIALQSVVAASLKSQQFGYVGPEVQSGPGTAYFERYETRTVLTHLGRIEVRRAYYWNAQAQQGVIPLDVRWQLDSRAPSPTLRRSLAMLGAEVPFARGAKLLEQIGLVEVNDKRVLESSEAMGHTLAQARQQAAEQVAFEPDAKYPERPWVYPCERRGTLYILMDGGRVHTRAEGWKEPKVATLYWDYDSAEVSQDRREILHKEYVATLGDADALARLLWEGAVRWKFWTAERIVVLGDGAPWIWNRAKQLFPEAVQILDRYHVNERVWDVARNLFGTSGKHKEQRSLSKGNVIELRPKPQAMHDWVTAQMLSLDEGRLDDLFAELRRQSQDALSADVRSVIDEALHYLEDNRHRMRYDHYRKQGLTIGSGAIESGVKNVVNQRMKGCGMRWDIDRAESMLHLRASYLSDIGPGARLMAS